MRYYTPYMYIRKLPNSSLSPIDAPIVGLNWVHSGSKGYNYHGYHRYHHSHLKCVIHNNKNNVLLSVVCLSEHEFTLLGRSFCWKVGLSANIGQGYRLKIPDLMSESG